MLLHLRIFFSFMLTCWIITVDNFESDANNERIWEFSSQTSGARPDRWQPFPGRTVGKGRHVPKFGLAEDPGTGIERRHPQARDTARSGKTRSQALRHRACDA